MTCSSNKGWPTIHRSASYVLSLLLLAAPGCIPELELGDAALGTSEYLDAGVATPAVAVTIATYNVENFDRGGAAAAQYSAVAGFAAAEEVDVLVLQEIQNDAAGDDESEFTLALERLLYPLPYHAMSSMSDGFNAVGIWSRFPLSNADEILEENTRTVLRFSIELDTARLWFFGCHLKSGDDEASRTSRCSEAARLEAHIAAHRTPASEQIVVLGDMNTMSYSDWLDSGTMSHLTLCSDNPSNTSNDFTAVNYAELPDEWTYPSQSSLLDHILLSRSALESYHAGSVRVARPTGDDGHAISDHLPVLLDLRY